MRQIMQAGTLHAVQVRASPTESKSSPHLVHSAIGSTGAAFSAAACIGLINRAGFDFRLNRILTPFVCPFSVTPFFAVFYDRSLNSSPCSSRGLGHLGLWNDSVSVAVV